MTIYTGPDRPAPTPEPDRTTCQDCHGDGGYKHHIWEHGERTDLAYETCPGCGGTGEAGRNRKPSQWDAWLKEREVKHGNE